MVPRTFRITPAQNAHLEAAAAALGTRAGAYLRELIERDRRQGQPADERPPIADREEVLELLTEQARAGSVTAARILLKSAGAPRPARVTDPLDELAARRAQTT